MRIVEYWRGGVAPLEDHSTAPLPNFIDASRQVAQEVAGPTGELAQRIVNHEMEMVGHHGDRMDEDLGVVSLCSSKPLEHRLVDRGFRAEEEAPLMAASGDHMVGTRFVTSESSAHGIAPLLIQKSKICAFRTRAVEHTARLWEPADRHP